MLLGQMTSDPVIGPQFTEGRFFCFASALRDRTSCMKTTTCWRINRRGNLPLEHLSFPACFRIRNRSGDQQNLCVWVQRLAKYVDVNNAAITKIEDASALQQRYSAIFKDAKDGQYIVETPDAIILYDFEHDRIVQRFEFRRVTIS